ncbi:alpha,alpha-trehalase TreF [Pedobacter steynii]|uniref:Trehalase n=1 Tax=Pedobacter steynii TaxID=430522 RepID=A0A1D7QEH1_9SPHI|nr:alpha,alpha-trehalase TreF [Pedobacter steynii]AOM77014.1 trehalase [Pedobacter steynii]
MSSHLFYIEDLQELFSDVQLKRIFADQKFFPDCLPKFAATEIVAKYRIQKSKPDFDLLAFVKANFILPPNEEDGMVAQEDNPVSHIHLLWDKLTRKTEAEFSSLIQLPHQFVVPGGRFREFFYWDSYFTMLGLQVSGRIDLIENMVDNFAYLISEFGFIPNGNRSYFLSRSQPPFFSLMVELLAEEKGESCYLKYLSQLKIEYAFWMGGAEGLSLSEPASAHVVMMPDGELLNRFWDKENTPRPEGFYEDLEIFNHAVEGREDLYRNIRAACASGWDFSGRWFTDGQDIRTIRTTDLIPADLNSLLWHLEFTLAKSARLANDGLEAENYTKKATRRLLAIRKYLWNEEKGGYFDYDFKGNVSSEAWSVAMAFPLFFGLANETEATRVLQHLQGIFLKDGGLLTTPNVTGQQWDAPNGWAPLQWIGYRAALNYGALSLASGIAKNWIGTVERVFRTTGKMMEKYNVTDTSLAAGGGEYPNQNGFGWTNGVYLKMKMSE